MIDSWITALKLDELQDSVCCVTNQQILVSQLSSIRLCPCCEERHSHSHNRREDDANNNMNLIAVLRRRVNDV